MSRSTTISEPTAEPLSLAEAKKHLEIAQSDDAHDQHVASLIMAAREKLERDASVITTNRTVVEKMACFPVGYSWRLTQRPPVSITHIKYYDTANSLTTLSSANYSLDADRRLVQLGSTVSLPSVYDRWDAVQITYVAGHGEDGSFVPEVYKQLCKLLVENFFEDRHKDSGKLIECYENLIRPYVRADYP